nr:Shedu anti-phage system protein SduA domain-containing protein [Nocardioides sp. 503]
MPLLTLSHIVSRRDAGALSPDQVASESNLIVLCPAHNHVTAASTRYTAEWLKQVKATHERRVREGIELAATPAPRRVSTTVRGPLVDALDTWNARDGQETEEHWQQLLMATPACFAMMLQGRAFRLGGKSYVGGKRVDNRGGNELDFLAVHATSLACIEIKTASAGLLGKRYRGNVVLPSEELVGGCVQVLESRRSLMQNLDLLNARAEPVDRLTADSPPMCFVVIGDLSRENFTVAERTSFDLFRRSLRDVQVYTFDELFDGVAQILEVTEPA